MAVARQGNQPCRRVQVPRTGDHPGPELAQNGRSACSSRQNETKLHGSLPDQLLHSRPHPSARLEGSVHAPPQLRCRSVGRLPGKRRPRGEHSVQGDELHHPVILQAEDGQVRCLLGVGHRPPSHATDEEETVGCLQGEGDVCGTGSPDEHGTLLQHDPDSDPEDDTDPGEHAVDEEAQQGRRVQG